MVICNPFKSPCVARLDEITSSFVEQSSCIAWHDPAASSNSPGIITWALLADKGHNMIKLASLLHRHSHQICAARHSFPIFLQVLSKILPKTWQNLLLHPVNLACTMTPFGSYCLMSGHVVRLVDSATQPQLLQITFDQLFSKVRVISEKANAAQSVWQRFLSDHRLQSYKDGLHTSLSSMIPILFMGGKISDYQPMLLQRQTADGETLIHYRHARPGLSTVRTDATSPVTAPVAAASLRLPFMINPAFLQKQVACHWCLLFTATLSCLPCQIASSLTGNSQKVRCR